MLEREVDASKKENILQDTSLSSENLNFASVSLEVESPPVQQAESELVEIKQAQAEEVSSPSAEQNPVLLEAKSSRNSSPSKKRQSLRIEVNK